MMKKIVIAVAAVMLCASGVLAQDRAGRGACGADIKKHCGDVEPGGARIAGCIKDHVKDFSEPCQTRLSRIAATAKTCKADVKERCGDVRPGRARVARCLRSALPDLSDACKDGIAQAVARLRSR
jgi:hypothetical protein